MRIQAATLNLDLCSSLLHHALILSCTTPGHRHTVVHATLKNELDLPTHMNLLVGRRQPPMGCTAKYQKSKFRIIRRRVIRNSSLPVICCTAQRKFPSTYREVELSPLGTFLARSIQLCSTARASLLPGNTYCIPA